MKQTTLLDRISNFIDEDISKTTYLTHGIHPYPAKYIPQLPREIIIANTVERNIILDPFCGSGTTLLEASLNGRKSIGIDSNPIATLISSAKTQVLSMEELDEIEIIIHKLIRIDLDTIKKCEVPVADNLDHWFTEVAIIELSWLKNFIDVETEGHLKNFLLCIFSSIIVNVSNQESNTRYAAKQKNIVRGSVITKFVNKLNNEFENIKLLSLDKKAQKNVPQIYNKDSREITSNDIKDNSIDLVVTSPPYPNSYDYYLYHKWRMNWLGYDVKAVRDTEVGSRNEHSSKKAPIEVFENKMIPILTNVSRMLKPNKLAYFFIGDSIISGEFIDMSESFKRIASQSGLKYVNETKYDLDSVTRYFYEKRSSSNKNKFCKMQHVLVFEPSKDKSIYINRNINNNKLEAREAFLDKDEHIIAKPKSQYKPLILGKEEIEDKSVVSIVDSNSNNPIHSLGKYPAKFIPEIPRWAIEKYSKKGDAILDPFNGSGTTVTEALLLGRSAYAIDISPYSCLITKSKTTKYSIDKIKSDTSKLISLIDNFDEVEEIKRKNFENDTFWFDEKYLEEIEKIKHIINSNFDDTIKDFFYGILSTTIKPCSYLDESQVKVKRDHKKLLNGTISPLVLMKKNLLKYEKSLISFNEELRDDVNIKIFNDSILNANKLLNKESIDLIVTSPPYINAMNYSMNHRYENILLDLVDPEQNIKHQTKYIGTERVYAKDYKKCYKIDENLRIASILNPKLEEIYQSEPKRSYIAYKYFNDMYNSFRSIYDVLKPGGRIVIVAGTNKIRGVDIDTFGTLVEMLKDLGMEYELSYHYEIVKNALKIKRHDSADIIKFDGVAVFRKGE